MGNLKLMAAALALTGVVSVGLTWGFTASYYTAKLNAKHAAYEKEKSDAALAAATYRREQERAVAAAVAEADRQHFTELQNAKNEISQLRAGLARGTVRLRQPSTACGSGTTTTARRADVGNDGRTEHTASEPTVEQDILQLGEYALTAVKQRDACVAILQQEREVLNEK